MNVPDTFWAYFAGFFDGEGSISVHGNSIGLLFSQSGHVGKLLMEEFYAIFKDGCHLSGRLRIVETDPCLGNLVRKPKVIKKNYSIQIRQKADVVFVLTKMLPFLRVKKVYAQDCLRFLRLFPKINGAAVRALNASCKRGHRRTKENTGYGMKRGKMYKYCLTCVKNATAARRAA